jgi:sarcosine oxidase subunit gamma
VTDQSDGRSIIRVSGSRAAFVLAKGVMIDLHPRAFGSGDVAITAVAHIGVQFWQIDATPTYEFVCFRSFAADFWHWLIEAGSEFGVAVGKG